MEALSLPGKGDRIIKGHSEKQNFRPPGLGVVLLLLPIREK